MRDVGREFVQSHCLISKQQHQWASSRFLLGIQILEEYIAGRPSDIEHAIAAFNDAITIWTPVDSPRNWSRTKLNLGTCHLKKRIGLKVENVECAIDQYKEALKVADRSEWPDHWATLQDALGQAYRQRLGGDFAENLELAIDYLTASLSVRSPETGLRSYALCLNNLGNAHLDRVLGEPSDNVERAMAFYRQALTAIEPHAGNDDDDLRALLSQNLGLAYRDRMFGDPEKDRELALSYIGRAVDIYKQLDVPHLEATTIANLASVYLMERFRHLQTRRADLNFAIDQLTVALRTLDEEISPHEWATAKVLLGQAYMERARFIDREEGFQNAIDHLEASLRVRTQSGDPLEWARTMQTLGSAHSMRGNAGAGIECYNKTLAVYTTAFPFERRRTLKNIGNSFFEQGEFEKALPLFEEAIKLGEDLLWISNTPRAKHVEAAEISVLYPNLAYSLLALGKRDESIVSLDRGKALLMVQALSLSDLAVNRLDDTTRKRVQALRDEIRGDEKLLSELLSQGSPEDVEPVQQRLERARRDLRGEIAASGRGADTYRSLAGGLTVTEILELVRPGELLVAPIVTPRGVAVIMVPAGVKTVEEQHVFWLDYPELYQMLHPAQPVYNPGSTEQFHDWLYWYSVWRSDVLDETLQNRESFLDDLLQALWKGVMEHVHQYAKQLAVHTLLLLPQGGLQLLPLHAAWRLDDGERRYLLDDYVIYHAPSAWLLRQCRLRSDELGKRRALCVAVKRYKDFLHLRPLPFAHVEAREVSNITKAKLMRDKEATAASVVENVQSFTHVHFACHATVSNDPLAAALQLGGYGAMPRDELQVRQIISDLNLSETRLVTLAACETGVIDYLLSADEYVGIPGSLLWAGAAGVVTSLFMVHDLASCLLWRCFYDFHWNQGLEPAAALRAAQRCLRDMTADELRVIAESWRPEDPNAAEELLFAARVDRPFSHPLKWSGFVYVGA